MSTENNKPELNKPGNSVTKQKSDLSKADNNYSSQKPNDSLSTVDGMSNKPEIRRSERFCRNVQRYPITMRTLTKKFLL